MVYATARRRWEVKITGTLFSNESNFYANHASFPSSRASEETKLGAISTVKLREDRELQEKSDAPRKTEIKGESYAFYVIWKSGECQDLRKGNIFFFERKKQLLRRQTAFRQFPSCHRGNRVISISSTLWQSAGQHINLSAREKKSIELLICLMHRLHHACGRVTG